jgi:valyl-tRNA synthetase
VLEQILHVLHPFMPYVTEELWAHMGEGERPHKLIRAAWPQYDFVADKAADQEMDWVVRMVSEIRAVRSEMNVPPSARLKALLRGASATTEKRVATHRDLIQTLARLEELTVTAEAAPKGAVQVVVDEATVVLPLAGVIDVAQEQARLAKELGKVEGEIAKIDKKLANEAFIAKADPEVVAEQRERRDDYGLQRGRLAEALERLKAL